MTIFQIKLIVLAVDVGRDHRRKVASVLLVVQTCQHVDIALRNTVTLIVKKKKEEKRRKQHRDEERPTTAAKHLLRSTRAADRCAA